MNADVAIVGAGYVGMPLAQAFGKAGKNVVLIDVKPEVVEGINRGESHIGDVPSRELKQLVEAGVVSATTDFDALQDADAILIALPTPLSSQREPDLSIVRTAVEEIAPRLGKGQLVVLESTTYPGTTRECVQPILETSGLKAGEDFHLAFSPERVDPGRTDWTTQNTPKLVGGLTPACTDRAAAAGFHTGSGAGGDFSACDRWKMFDRPHTVVEAPPAAVRCGCRAGGNALCHCHGATGCGRSR